MHVFLQVAFGHLCIRGVSKKDIFHSFLNEWDMDVIVRVYIDYLFGLSVFQGLL